VTEAPQNNIFLNSALSLSSYNNQYHKTTPNETTPRSQAAMATAYLFKVPEGAAKGCDPGFFHQMVCCVVRVR
jgi:hypothetical protein